MGLYAEIDYNLILVSTPKSTPCITFIMGNPMPESTLTLCQSRLYPPVRDFEFGLWSVRFSSDLCKKGTHSIVILTTIKNDLAYILYQIPERHGMALIFWIKNSFYDLSWLDTYRMIDNRMKSIDSCPEFNRYNIIDRQNIVAHIMHVFVIVFFTYFSSMKEK
jgi:hypothetical protein